MVARQKNIRCKGGITKIILSSFAVMANNLPGQNDTKKTSLSDVQPEVHIFYFLREACPHSPLLYYAQNNSNSTPPNKSKDHCVKNNVHFYNKKWNVSWLWKNLSYHHVTTVAVLFCYFRCCLLYSIAISLRSVVACRNDVIHQSFHLREGVDSFKVVELKKSGKIIYIILFWKHFSH